MQNIKSLYKFINYNNNVILNNFINRYYSTTSGGGGGVNKIVNTSRNQQQNLINYNKNKKKDFINKKQKEISGEVKKKYNNKHIMERDPQDRSLSQKQYFEKLADRGDVEKMINLIKHMPENKSVYAYEKLILACSISGKFNQSWSLYNQMKKDNLKPSIYIFGTLINTCTTSTGLDSTTIENRINKIVEEIEKYEIEVSINFFNIIMKTMIVIGKYDSAITFIDKMKQSGLKPDITSYTTWISAISEKFKQDNQFDINQKEFLNQIRLSKNSQLLDELRSEGNKQIDHYMDIVKQVKQSQVKPDRYFINTVLNACKNTKNPEGVFHVWETMQQMKFTQHLNADTKTFDILISTCNNINNIEKAIDIFNEMLVKSIRPDIYLINNLFRTCLRISSIKSQIKRDQYNIDELINKIMDYMASYNLYPNEESFSVLISTYSKLNQHNKVYELLLEMKELNIQPNIKHYSGIISSFSNDVNKCLEIFKIIISQKIKLTPDFIVHMQNIVNHGNDNHVEEFTNLLRIHDNYTFNKQNK